MLRGRQGCIAVSASVIRHEEELKGGFSRTVVVILGGSNAQDAAQRAIRRSAHIVNFRLQEQLNDDDLHDFRSVSDATGITPKDLRSFENADCVLRANHHDTEETH